MIYRKRLTLSVGIGIVFIVIIIQIMYMKTAVRFSKSLDLFDINSISKKRMFDRLKNVSQLETFTRVSMTEDIYVFSAYFEDERNRLRVIGLAAEHHEPSTLDADMYCLVWYNKSRFITKAYIANINENHYGRVTAAYFVCNTRGSERPLAVSLIKESSNRAHEQSEPNNILPVRDKQSNMQLYLVACVSPLHTYYSNSHQLVEWVELNRLLGVEFFSVYVEDVSNAVYSILRYYEKMGILEIISWNIPVLNIHYHGQLAAINDCLYRNKNISKFLMITDLDEFIIPQSDHALTIKDMLNTISTSRKSVYMFRHVRVYRQTVSESENTDDVNLLSLEARYRLEYIESPGDRSKLIVSTEDLVTMGIHNIWALRKGEERYVVEPSVGLLHHYSGFVKPGLRLIEHTVTRKYSMQLKSNVRKVLKDI